MAATEKALISTAIGPGISQIAKPSNLGEPIIARIPPEERERLSAGRSFRLEHNLGHHPALSLDGIRDLVERMLTERRFDQIFYKTGKSMTTGRYADEERRSEILTVLENFDNSGVWLRLTRVDEVSPMFNEIVEKFYTEISEVYQQDVKARTMRTFVALFVSSPGAYTNYHIDHTWNFLLQISGRKTVHLYDPLDPEVITQNDKEQWYMRNFTLIPRAQDKGMAYELEPGVGVHHPVNAPHWVQNGSEVSVSLSIGLCLHDSNRDAKVHQANFLLRKLGLRPTPPRLSKWRDGLKVSFLSLLSEKNSKSLDKAVFSGATRLRKVLRIKSADGSYDPK